MLKFEINEEKALEALVWLANAKPGITAFYVSKVLFYAEKDHLNRYGRPIVADTFIAMPNGPVPSAVYDILKGEFAYLGVAEMVPEAIETQGYAHPLKPRRQPDLTKLSRSDIECLQRALERYGNVPFGRLSEQTHREPAWSEAPINGAMDYERFLDADNPERDAILAEAKEFAAYGVL